MKFLRRLLRRLLGRDRRAVEFFLIVGKFQNTVGTVARTPQYHRFPLFGEPDMAVEMTTIDQFSVSIAPKNKKGGPAPVDGAPTWLTSNSDVLALEPSADGLSCLVKAVGLPGSATVQVTADADMGAGVTAIVGTIDVNVALAPATTIEVIAGPVEEQP